VKREIVNDVVSQLQFDNPHQEARLEAAGRKSVVWRTLAIARARFSTTARPASRSKKV
jgi:hypothetical protein